MDGTAYIGLGGNLGQPLAQMSRALARLDAEVVAVSRLYRTAPLYVSDQPSFLNAAARLRTSAAPQHLLDHLKALERALGREHTARFGPRTLDLDILLWGAEGALVLCTPRLTIPHPRLLERAFALIPLADVAPDLVHPLCGRTIAELAAASARDGVTLEARAGWHLDEAP